MGFWGIEVKPGKPHKYHSSDVEGTIYVTQATLGLGSTKEKCVLQCSSRDRSPVYLCSLLPDQTECCPLSLEFEDADDIVFSVVGSRSIHVAGKFVADEGHSDEDCYDSDSLGEDIADTETDDSNDYGSEDEYGGDFIDDDDTNLLPPSAVPSSGVTIEEIVDDDKPTNGNSKSKRPKKKNQINDSEENKKSQRQTAAKSSSGVTVMESEDEDGFPICSSHRNDVTMQNPEAEEEQIGKRTTEKTKKKKTKDSEERATSVKRKVEDADQDHQPEREPKAKKNKKRKQQKEQGEEEKANEAGDQPEDVKQQNLSQISSAGSDLDLKAMNGNEICSEEKKKKKKKKKNKTEGGDLTSKEITVSGVGDKGVSTMQVEEHNETKSSQARTFGNGLVIEELTMGKPDGKRASPGKLVSVHYIGKLKKNGEVFDSNNGTTPFKFRLGVGGVIKGWDVGVNGMRVGDKRRLTIPPSMGYGAEGAGEKIPPNSWLVFDVELVDVR